eukprot:scaffold34635_cov80-Phaeocystis_antarctica.AAC.1
MAAERQVAAAPMSCAEQVDACRAAMPPRPSRKARMNPAAAPPAAPPIGATAASAANAPFAAAGVVARWSSTIPAAPPAAGSCSLGRGCGPAGSLAGGGRGRGGGVSTRLRLQPRPETPETEADRGSPRSQWQPPEPPPSPPAPPAPPLQSSATPAPSARFHLRQSRIRLQPSPPPSPPSACSRRVRLSEPPDEPQGEPSGGGNLVSPMPPKEQLTSPRDGDLASPRWQLTSPRSGSGSPRSDGEGGDGDGGGDGGGGGDGSDGGGGVGGGGGEHMNPNAFKDRVGCSADALTVPFASDDATDATPSARCLSYVNAGLVAAAQQQSAPRSGLGGSLGWRRGGKQPERRAVRFVGGAPAAPRPPMCSTAAPTAAAAPAAA